MSNASYEFLNDTFLKAMEDSMSEAKPYELCQELIWIEGAEGHANTYCMRPKGHPGKHNIENAEPPEKPKKEGEK